MLVSLEEVHHGAEVICMVLCLRTFKEIKRDDISKSQNLYNSYLNVTVQNEYA